MIHLIPTSGASFGANRGMAFMSRSYRSYLKMHRGAIYYQRPIPKTLQHLFQGACLIRERIGKFVAGKEDKLARAEALHRADRDDKLFKSYAANTDTILAAGGGGARQTRRGDAEG